MMRRPALPLLALGLVLLAAPLEHFNTALAAPADSGVGLLDFIPIPFAVTTTPKFVIATAIAVEPVD